LEIATPFRSALLSLRSNQPSFHNVDLTAGEAVSILFSRPQITNFLGGEPKIEDLTSSPPHVAELIVLPSSAMAAPLSPTPLILQPATP
jgi:hypothetical protein